MTTVFIASLIAIALYLAKRWSDTSAENSELRAQVASLKRQLSRRDR
jgi:type II secretory pathway pseudopilin PulG